MNLEMLPRFLETLGLDGPPMGIMYTDVRPDGGFSPQPSPLPTVAREQMGA